MIKIGNAARFGSIKFLGCMRGIMRDFRQYGIGLTWQPLQAPIQPALPRPCSDMLPESNDKLPLLTV